MERANQWSRKPPILPSGDQLESSMDRISSLPDSILHHILSFMPTKFAVATSVLARRWKSLWTEVPILDFDGDSHKNWYLRKISMIDIVYEVLLYNKAPFLNSFRLSTDERCNDYQIKTWTGIAMARGVQLLELCLIPPEFDIWHTVKLPVRLFTCKTLVHLKLNHCVCINVAANVCLPSLKILHLAFVSYESDESLPRLVSGCLSLEDLKIERLIDEDEVDVDFSDLRYPKYDNMISCRIFSPSVKKLWLDFQYCKVELIKSNEKEYELEINTPGLQYLHLEDLVSWRMSIGNLPSLMQASFYGDKNRYKILGGFRECICRARLLTVSNSMIQILCSPQDASPVDGRLDNLIKLDMNNDWKFLMSCLESADNLESVIFKLNGFVDECWLEPNHVPICLSSSLKFIAIHEFGFHENGFKIVEYILRNAKVLERMEIYYGCSDSGEDIEAKFKVFQRIAAYPRGSVTCKLEFD